jgi:hypothetical protein
MDIHDLTREEDGDRRAADGKDVCRARYGDEHAAPYAAGITSSRSMKEGDVACCQ